MGDSYFSDLVSNVSGGVYVIAEACDNHMGSLDMAKALVDLAISAEADAVKFQHHIAKEELLPGSQMSDNFDEDLYDFLERNALSLDDHKKLKQYCDTVGIQYLCTPFSLVAAQQIKDLVPFFKIGSGEFRDYLFTDQLIKLGKPILFSTGMCSSDELDETVDHYQRLDFDFALMNCLSEYPPEYQNLNLKLISTMADKYRLIVGHSDHTNTIASSILAIGFGARIIEKHVTLSEFVRGPDRDVSIKFEELRELVAAKKWINSALGNEKILHEKENSVRSWAYRSLVSRREISAGEVLDLDNVTSKRPGNGIPSHLYPLVLGKCVRVDIPANQAITEDDIFD